MAWEQIHPAINAALNFTCFVFLVLGRMAIARRATAMPCEPGSVLRPAAS